MSTMARSGSARALPRPETRIPGASSGITIDGYVPAPQPNARKSTTEGGMKRMRSVIATARTTPARRSSHSRGPLRELLHERALHRSLQTGRITALREPFERTGAIAVAAGDQHAPAKQSGAAAPTAIVDDHAS